MIKKMLMQLTLLLLPLTISAGIVNNSGIQATDSLTFEFYLLDSAGQTMPQLVSTDSIFIHVYYPSGSLAYRDSIAGNNATITETANSNFYTYSLRRLVGNIDGTGRDGLYKWLIIAKDNSLGLLTPLHGEFQLYQGADYHALLDFIKDSLQSVLDTLQRQDDWIATAANQTTLSSEHSTLLSRTTLIEDTVDAIIDSLQAGVSVAMVQPDVVTSSALASSAIDEIVDGVWDELQVAHTISGSFGGFLDADISGLGSGSGAFSYSIALFDTITTQMVPGVSVVVRNLEQTALVAVGRTDLSGKIFFNLDAGSYAVIASAPGYQFNPYDTLVVSASGLDTLKGISFDPGSPVSPSLCRVYGFLYDISGLPQKGSEIKASLAMGVYRQGGLVVSPFEVSTTSDSLGYFYLDLIPSDSLLPVSSPYKLTIVSPKGTVMRRSFLIPASGSWQLTW